MSFKILEKKDIRRHWVSLIYGLTGCGKTTLCWTAVAAGWTPLFVQSENKDMAQWMTDMVYDAGGQFATATQPSDFDKVLSSFKQAGTKFDMLIFDGLTKAIQDYLSEKLPISTNTQGVYGTNMNLNIRFMLGLESVGVPVLLTALEKVDRLYSGGPEVEDKKVEKEVYMPAFPGQLEHLIGGIGCDLVARLKASGPTRTLQLEPSSLYISRVPTGYSMKNILKPTIHKLLADYQGAPQPRLSYEETIKLLETNGGK